MKVKYLLSGRLLSDINHLRKLIDSWPDNIPFPDIEEDFKNINPNDIVLTFGYLGQSSSLIRIHNPDKIFILDNAIFPTKGIHYFRVLNGNLDSVLKNDNLKSENLLKNFYENRLLEINKKFQRIKTTQKVNSIEKLEDQHQKIIEFPWSIPLKKLIEIKNIQEIIDYNFNVKSILNEGFYKLDIYEKNGAIKIMNERNIPILRTYNKKQFTNLDIINSEYILCPTSSLALISFLFKKKSILSKFNPYHKYILNNPNLRNYENETLIDSLSQYLGKLNFSVSELYRHLPI